MPRDMWTVSRDVGSSADSVWRVLTDLEAWPRWGPTVSRAEIDGGAFELGASELEQGRCWGWRVAGVPATRHGVRPREHGSTVWMSAPVWAPGYLPVLAIALRRIETMSAQFRSG